MEKMVVYLQLRHLSLASVLGYGLSRFVAAFIPSTMIFYFLHHGAGLYVDGPERIPVIAIFVIAIAFFFLSLIALVIGHFIFARFLWIFAPLKLSFCEPVEELCSTSKHKIMGTPLAGLRFRSAAVFGAISLLVAFVPMVGLMHAVILSDLVLAKHGPADTVYRTMEFVGRVLFFGYLASMIGHFILTKVFRSASSLHLFFKVPVGGSDENSGEEEISHSLFDQP